MAKAAQTVGARVRQIREETGLNLSNFAKQYLSGSASARNVSRIESGEVAPTEKTLERIAHGKYDMSWLRTGELTLSPGASVRVPGLAARLTEVRTARKLNKLQLSRQAGLGETSKNVGRIENREVAPRYSTILRLASALGVEAAYLIHGHNAA